MHGSGTCNCSDARRDREDDQRPNDVPPGGGDAVACRCLISHTAASLCQSKQEDVGELVGYCEKVKCGRCKSRFCEHESCLKASGRALKRRLLPVLETFEGLMMLTLTVDPKLFSSPLEAFKFLKKRRCVAKFIDSLHKQGWLFSRRYFYVVEWQMGKGEEKGTEMPHFHVLVDSTFIDMGAIKTAWNRYRPKSAGPVIGNAPGFGHARFSKKRFAGGAAHAAHYACKYLMKHPEKGYPLWVTTSKLQIKRFSTSRGLLSDGRSTPQRDRPKRHPSECKCEECEARRERRTTIAERTAKCGRTTILVSLPLYLNTDGEVVEGRPKFRARIDVPFHEVMWLMDVDDPAGSYEVSHSNWEDILQLSRRPRRVRGAPSAA